MTKEPIRPVCFVIMPISDMHGYEPGHFGRVYEHLLKPAIIEAGFHPIRADDANKTDYIVVGIIQQLVDAAMVLCDFSARNPNVMYELGIRHAFNLPVALVRDKRTDKVFDIQGLRYMDYDESLRVDSVQKDISKIAKALKETASDEGDGFNSVVHLAGIRTAKLPDRQQVSPDTQLILSALAGLERRVEATQGKQTSRKKYFSISGKGVVFGDKTSADMGEEIYINGTLVGRLSGVDKRGGIIQITTQEGEMRLYSAEDDASEELTSIPF